MEEVIRKFDKPEVTADPMCLAPMLEELGHDHLGIVDRDDRDLAAAQRRQCVLGVGHCQGRLYLRDNPFQLPAFHRRTAGKRAN
jgi:hypothetical protein